MSHLTLRDVCVQYEVMQTRDYNLKRQVVHAIGRRGQLRPVIQALNGISLEIDEGSRLGLIGPNGAGKSTLLSVMAGLLPPTSGSVTRSGRVLALLGSAATGLDPESTGRDNIIRLGVQLGETPRAMRHRIEDITEFSGLSARIDHPVYTYSSGMLARLRFSLLTSLRPDVLIIDEGIGMADAEFAERGTERLTEFMSSAGILVIASHAVELIARYCTSAVWIDQGTVMQIGEVDRVVAAYHASYAQTTPEAELAVEAEPEPSDDAADRRRNRTVAARFYWQFLGRNGDPEGLDVSTELLTSGQIEPQAFAQAFYDCEEAQIARARFQGTMFLGISHDLPFALKSEPGATHMVVTLPGIGSHRYVPAHLPWSVDAPVHELAIGMANQRPFTPAEVRAWAADAAALIHESAAKVGVAVQAVAIVGYSYQAWLSLLVGIEARVGLVIAGAPNIRMGRSIAYAYHLAHAAVEESESSAWDGGYPVWDISYNAGGLADSSARRDFDGLLPSAAAESPARTTLAILTSRSDTFFGEVERFVDQLASNSSSIECDLRIVDEADHEKLGGEHYPDFLREQLDRFTAVEPPPDPGAVSLNVHPVIPAPGLDADPDDGELHYEKAAYRAYWQVLGRQPDREGRSEVIQQLKAGVPLGTLMAEMRASSEWRDRFDAHPADWYLGLNHDIPFRTDRREGAEHLTVTFPGVGTHRAPPVLLDEAALPGYAAVHRLALGFAMNRVFRLEEAIPWFEDAAALVRQRAAELGVPMDNVICVGSSMEGLMSLMVGVTAGAGYCISGAPTLGGSVVRQKSVRSSRARHGETNLASYLSEQAQIPDSDNDLVEAFVPAALNSATHVGRIELFVSPKDLFWDSANALSRLMASHPTLTCDVVEASYEGHDNIRPQFDRYLHRRIEELTREVGNGGRAYRDAVSAAGRRRSLSEL